MDCAKTYLGFVPPEPSKNGQPRAHVCVRVHDTRTLWLPFFFLLIRRPPLRMRILSPILLTRTPVLQIKFFKSTMFRKTIETKSLSETRQVWESFIGMTKDAIRKRKPGVCVAPFSKTGRLCCPPMVVSSAASVPISMYRRQRREKMATPYPT